MEVANDVWGEDISQTQDLYGNIWMSKDVYGIRNKNEFQTHIISDPHLSNRNSKSKLTILKYQKL